MPVLLITILLYQDPKNVQQVPPQAHDLSRAAGARVPLWVTLHLPVPLRDSSVRCGTFERAAFDGATLASPPAWPTWRGLTGEYTLISKRWRSSLRMALAT